MEPKLNFIVVCESAFFTKGNDNLNIIGIFGKITAAKFPAVHPKMFVVSSVTAEPGNINYELVLRNESKEEVFRISGDANIPVDKTKVQMIGEIVNTPLTNQGKYSIEMIINGKLQSNTADFTVSES